MRARAHVFRGVQLFAIPWTVASQVTLSMEFSKQEYWRRVPIPIPGDLPQPGTEPLSPAFPAFAGGFFTTAPPGLPAKWVGPPILSFHCILSSFLALIIMLTNISNYFPDQTVTIMNYLYSAPLVDSSSMRPETFKNFTIISAVANTIWLLTYVQISSVQSPSRVQLFATPWTAAHQASLSITNSRSLLKLMSIEFVMPSNHLILYHPLLLPPSIFPSIRVFSNESFFTSGGQSNGVSSASASVLPMNTQD